jgi:hypothetical protein
VFGGCDAVSHNAGFGCREPQRGNTEDGLPPLFAIKTLAPCITALIQTASSRAVATEDGRCDAPDDPNLGRRAQGWLAVSDVPAALVTDQYFR